MSSLSNKQISVEKARELQKNWIGNQGSAIEEVMGIKDVRDFLFDLEELQQYLDQVRTHSTEQGINNPGIRIYFGAYGEEQEKRATIFLQATKDLLPAQQSDADQSEEQVENNSEIMPLNTVMGGFPPVDY